ncbi:HlyD family efflux transporter periplasmic adaptor subunit, partial [Klebsiella pneumoniae]|nr:HlyD family efflux transporter periplasmic adaptor subunit [Klebsiella pneumoniae]
QIRAQQANIATAQKQYQQAQAATRQQQVQLRYHRITAPFSGTVGDIPVKLGNYVQPLNPLLSVTDNNQLEINISVPSERATDLHVGL